MENNRPRSRERHVTGPGKTVEKRGEGLGTGPVGDAGGYADRGRRGQSSGTRSAGTRSGGGMKLILLLLAVLLGGGGGLTALLGGQPDVQAPSVQTPSAVQQQAQGGGVNWAAVLGGTERRQRLLRLAGGAEHRQTEHLRRARRAGEVHPAPGRRPGHRHRHGLHVRHGSGIPQQHGDL